MGMQRRERAKREMSPSHSTRGHKLHNKDSSDLFSIPFRG